MSSPQKKNPLSNVDPTSDGDPLSAVIISQSLMTGQTSSPGKGVSKHSSQKAELEVDQESLDGLTSTSDDGKCNFNLNID